MHAQTHTYIYIYACNRILHTLLASEMLHDYTFAYRQACVGAGRNACRQGLHSLRSLNDRHTVTGRGHSHIFTYMHSLTKKTNAHCKSAQGLSPLLQAVFSFLLFWFGFFRSIFDVFGCCYPMLDASNSGYCRGEGAVSHCITCLHLIPSGSWLSVFCLLSLQSVSDFSKLLLLGVLVFS